MRKLYKIISVLLIVMCLSTNVSIVYGGQNFGSDYVHYWSKQSDDWQKISKKVYESIPYNIRARISNFSYTEDTSGEGDPFIIRSNNTHGFGGYYNINTQKIEWGYAGDLKYEMTCKVPITIYKNEIGALNVEYKMDGTINMGNAGATTFKRTDAVEVKTNLDPITDTEWKKNLLNDIDTKITHDVDELIWWTGDTIKITKNDISASMLQDKAMEVLESSNTRVTIWFTINKTIVYTVKLATAKVYAIENSKDSSTEYQAFATVEPKEVINENPESFYEGNYEDPEGEQQDTTVDGDNNGSGDPGGIEDGTVIGSLNTGTPFIDPTTNSIDYKPADLTTTDTGELTTIAGTIIGIVRNIGVALGVIFLTALGLRYMFASIEEKAEYKETMMPYVLGAVLLMAGTVVIDFIYSVAIQFGK